MDITLLIVVLGLWIMFNITFYIPIKLKNNEEKISLHFKELNLRMNRIEEMIAAIDNKSKT